MNSFLSLFLAAFLALLSVFFTAAVAIDAEATNETTSPSESARAPRTVRGDKDVDQFFAAFEDMKAHLPLVDADSVVEIYYLEHVLASWVLQSSPWNAYHSGMGFKIYNDKERPDEPTHTVSVEYTPRRTGQVHWVLHPTITEKELDSSSIGSWVLPYLPSFMRSIYAWFYSEYDVFWQNEGGVIVSPAWSTKFTNVTHVGNTTGEIYNSLRDWIFEYQLKHRTFEPVEIILPPGHPAAKNASMGSLMCHDMFYNAIHHLIQLGVTVKPASKVFRDHIVVHASDARKVDINDPVAKRGIVRFFRLFVSFMQHINREFTSIRGMLVGASFLAVQPYLYKDGDYYEIDMVPPYVNYCYAVVSFPETAHFSQRKRICALEQTLSANATQAFLTYLSPSHAVYVADSVVENPLAALLLCSSLWLAAVSARNYHELTVSRPRGRREGRRAKSGSSRARR